MNEENIPKQYDCRHQKDHDEKEEIYVVLEAMVVAKVKGPSYIPNVHVIPNVPVQ